MNLRQWCSCSIAVGISMFLVGIAFHFLVSCTVPAVVTQYDNLDLYRPWSGWTSIYMAMHPFFYAPVFAALFLKLRQKTGFPCSIQGGLIYAVGVFFVGSLPIFLLVFASFQVSIEILLTWVFQNLCQYLAAGFAIGTIADGATVCVSTRLPASVGDVWERLLRKETFLYIIRGWLTVRNSETWPATLFLPATTFVMKIQPFGLGPPFSHSVHVTRVDHAAKEIQTEEAGQLVTLWNHQMRVSSIPGGQSQYTDRIHLQAGLLTPPLWLFANLFYRARQRRLRRLFDQSSRGSRIG